MRRKQRVSELKDRATDVTQLDNRQEDGGERSEPPRPADKHTHDGAPGEGRRRAERSTEHFPGKAVRQAIKQVSIHSRRNCERLKSFISV